MMKTYYSIVFYLITITFIWGQEENPFPDYMPKIFQPSPEISNLLRFNEVPIDIYTGQPIISFPLYKLKLSENFSLNLELNYNTMGIRVDEVSSWTGSGWSLIGVPYISRVVNGYPDEINEMLHSFKKGVYHNNFFETDFSSNPINNQSYSLNNFLWNTAGRGSNSLIGGGDYDSELDKYNISIPTGTASFVITKNLSLGLQVNFLTNDSNIKIKLDYNPSSYEINYFEVIDQYGNEFLFSQKEINSIQSSNFVMDQMHTYSGYTIPSFNYVSTWKIQSIKDINNKIIATFTYSDFEEKFKNPNNKTFNSIERAEGTAIGNFNFVGEHVFNCKYNPEHCKDQILGYNPETITDYDMKSGVYFYNNNIFLPKEMHTSSVTTLNSKKINKILFNNKLLEFNYLGNSHTEYINNKGCLLDRLILKYKNDTISQWAFQFDNNLKGRVFLDKLIYHSNQNNLSEEYKLEYKNKNLLPEINNFDKDIWGYNKSLYKKLKLVASPSEVTNGVLSKIIFPSGGIKSFEFESNTISHISSDSLNLEFFKQNNPDNWNILNYNFSFNESSNQNFLFVINNDDVIVTLNSSSLNAPQDDSIIRIIDSSGNIMGGTEVNKSLSLTLNQGYYRVNFFNDLNINYGDYSVNTTLKITDYVDDSQVKKYIYGGGIRIKNIKFYDANDNLVPAKNISYIYHTENNNSYGIIDGFLNRYKEYTYIQPAVFQYTQYNGYSYGVPLDGFIKYNVQEKLNGIYASMQKGMFVGYSKVKVHEENNGYQLYEYTSPLDNSTFQTGYNEYNNWPFIPPDDKSYLQGLLTSQKVYDNENILLSETNNIYGVPIEIPVAFSLKSYDSRSCSHIQFYKTYGRYVQSQPEKNLYPYEYNNEGTIEFLFGNNCTAGSNLNWAAVLFKTYDLSFKKISLLKSIKKSYFDTGTIEQINQYEYSDYPKFQVVNQKSVNSTGEVLEQKFYYPQDLLSEPFMSGLVAENRIGTPIKTEIYRGTEENMEKLSETYTEYQDFDPTTEKQILPSSVHTGKFSDDPNDNNTTESKITYDEYDDQGNILQYTLENGTPVSIIWGYNGQYPLAKIEGATYTQIQSAVSNLQSLSNNDDDTCTGLSGCAEANLRNALRQLRINNPSYLITTYTYDPLIGVTSITAPDGSVAYYEYDGFGRLETVKDQDGNILKEMEYHYKEVSN